MPLAPYGRLYAAQATYMGADRPAPVTQLWVALSTSDVVDSSTSDTLGEPAVGEYARQLLTLSATTTAFTEAGGGWFTPEVAWDTVVATTWGAIVAFALMTAEEDGQLFAYGSLPLTEPVAGDVPRIPAGTLLFAMQG